MQADKTTLHDLSIFHHEEEQSVFHHLNFTTTVGGKDWLRLLLSRPLTSLQEITEAQQTIQSLIQLSNDWPRSISNGTIMVMEKYYDSQIETLPSHPNAVNSFFYQLINAPDYSLTKYSAEHFLHFTQGMNKIVSLFQSLENKPLSLSVTTERIAQLLSKAKEAGAFEVADAKKLSRIEALRFGHFFRKHFRHQAVELIDIFCKLDAYQSLATATLQYKFSFPEFLKTSEPAFEAKGLYHILLSDAVAYDVSLPKDRNFLFLTGANMAGKSTFIKAIGVSVFLAHIGMSVPANSLQLSLFDGLLSNIHVSDNIVKGESYFFNEVQRIRKTIEKISDGKKWLILIDELFKGTNVQDAMKCSTVVIEGLRKMENALFILSTHLYEIGAELRQYPNIQFKYFETNVKDEQLEFNYHLLDGISNDRLGYLILKREGVVEMLQKL
jgi:DNA mismatch repair protein MutS